MPYTMGLLPCIHAGVSMMFLPKNKPMHFTTLINKLISHRLPQYIVST